MKNLDAVYTDASCYESLMRFPTDVKLLWGCVERTYKMMCGISSQLGEHRIRTKYNDIEKADRSAGEEDRRWPWLLWKRQQDFLQGKRH